MLLSAVSVLVVAQSSSEIPEGLMNNPVFAASCTVAQQFAGVGSTLGRKYSLDINLPCYVGRLHSSEAASRSITNITTPTVSRSYRDRR